MIVLNTLKFGKDYSKLSEDIQLEIMKPISEYGLTESFYGGMVTHIAKVKDSNVYLLLDLETDGVQVRDIAVDSLDVDQKILRELARAKALEYSPVGVKKEELINMIDSACIKVG